MMFSTLIQSAVLAAASAAAFTIPNTHPVFNGSSLDSYSTTVARDPSMSAKDQAAAVRAAFFGRRDEVATGTETSTPSSSPAADPNPKTTDLNWAGAVLSPPNGEHWHEVTATVTLPHLSNPDTPVGPGGDYFLYVWVGIDGDGDCGGLWQTGFAGQIENGVTSWWGWVCL
jgi:hypothetical protein